jgi:hypothetical protein
MEHNCIKGFDVVQVSGVEETVVYLTEDTELALGKCDYMVVHNTINNATTAGCFVGVLRSRIIFFFPKPELHKHELATTVRSTVFGYWYLLTSLF